MKMCKRLCSLFLVLTMIVSTFSFGADVQAETGEEGVWFSDSFDEDSCASEWKSNNGFTITDDSMLVNGVVHLRNSAYLDWKNYTYEADVTITDESINAQKDGVAICAMVAGVTALNTYNSGLEYGLCYNPKDGSSYVRLIERTTTEVITKVNDVAVEYSLYDTVHMKMEVRGNELYCYYNDELVITYDAGTELSGTIGVRPATYKSVIDNVKVSALDSDIRFADTFNETYSSGWSVPSYFDISGDNMKLSNAVYLSKNTTADTWVNYSVEADVKLTQDKLKDSVTSGWFALVVGGNSNATGYEFGIFDSNYVRLYDRSKTINNGTMSNNVAYTYDVNESVHMKVEVRGTQIYCYVDDELVITYAGNTEISGNIGVRVSGYYYYIDNVIVKDLSSDILFADVFSGKNSTNTKGDWNTTNTISSEALSMSSGSRYTNTSITENKYTVEADVTINADSTDITNLAIPALCFGTNASGSGYEFGLCYNTDGSTYVRLYKRSSPAATYASAIKFDFQLKDKIHLKVMVDGNRFYCYANNQLLITHTVSDPITGKIALRTQNAATLFDNVVVKKVSDTDFMFAETFSYNGNTSYATTTGWNSHDKMNLEVTNKAISNRVATLTDGSQIYLNGYANAASWNNYSYEADVTLTSTEFATGDINVAAIVGGVNSANKGYEFGLCYHESADRYFVRLHDRINGRPIGDKDFDFDFNEPVHMKMELLGTLINCYANGELVLSVPVSTTTGTIGFRASCNNAIYDNLVVKRIPPLETREIPKNIFYDSFESTLADKGWGLTSNAAITNEELVIGGTNYSGYVYYTDNGEIANQWKNYSLEATVSLDEYKDGTNLAAFAIIAADLSRAQGGWEFGLLYDTRTESFSLRLLNRANTADSIVVPFTYTMGEKVHLKVQMNGTKLLCYADDELYIAKDTKNTNLRGYFGVRASTAIGTVDDLIVKQCQMTTEQVLTDEKYAEYINNDIPTSRFFERKESVKASYNKVLFSATDTWFTTNAISILDGYISTDVVIKKVADSFVNAADGTIAKVASLYIKNSETDIVEAALVVTKQGGSYDGKLVVNIHRSEVTMVDMYEYHLGQITPESDVYNIQLGVVENCVTVKLNGEVKIEEMFNEDSFLATGYKQFGLGTETDTINVLFDNVKVAYDDTVTYIVGDVNKDFLVNATDLTTLREVMVELVEPNGFRVDVNSDNEADVRDIARLKKILLGAVINLVGEAKNNAVYSGKTTTANYEDDFEDETVNVSPSHWQENYDVEGNVNNWLVYDMSNNQVYGTKNTSGNTATWLHAFDNNPKVSLKIRVDETQDTAKVGVITRMAPETAYVTIGYDFDLSKWYVATQNSLEEGTNYQYANETSSFELDKWHTLEIDTNGANVSVKLNDKKVLDVDNVSRTGYGRVGVFTENASMYIDDFECVYSSGDVPQDGILAYTVNPTLYATNLEIESIDENNLIAVNGKYKLASSDAGATWKNVTYDNTYASLYNGGMYTSLLKLHDGTYMQIKTDKFMSQTSSDLVTWTNGTNVVPINEQASDGKQLAIIHVNTLTEVNMGNGTYRVFCPVSFRKYNWLGESDGHYTKIYYTDDKGANWQVSETSSDAFGPKDDWAECKVIKCSDGTLRMYHTRNKTKYVSYTESKDNGETWSGFYDIKSMPCATTSFAIAEDSENEGTFYMLYVPSENPGDYIYPRSRICLMKSTDGKNWEFVMNGEYMSDTVYTSDERALYQILDPSLTVTNKYVYMTFGRSSSSSSDSHQAQRVYYIRVEKSALSN